MHAHAVTGRSPSYGVLSDGSNRQQEQLAALPALSKILKKLAALASPLIPSVVRVKIFIHVGEQAAVHVEESDADLTSRLPPQIVVRRVGVEEPPPEPARCDRLKIAHGVAEFADFVQVRLND